MLCPSTCPAESFPQRRRGQAGARAPSTEATWQRGHTGHGLCLKEIALPQRSHLTVRKARHFPDDGNSVF